MLNTINNTLIYSQRGNFFFFLSLHDECIEILKKLIIEFLGSEMHRTELRLRTMEFYLSFCSYLLDKDPREQNSSPL